MAIAEHLNRLQRRVPTWPFYVAFGIVPLWWLYLALTGGLGFEPIKALEHRLGKIGLQVLIASLAITPLRTLTGVNLVRFRRMLGLAAFYFIALHLLVWLVLDVRVLAQIWADIVKRPYITVGMVAFVLLIPLAVTSNNWSIRRLGPLRWRRLHRLAYLAALLGGLHFVLLVKGWQIEPLIYLGVVMGLLVLRLRLPRSWVRARA